MRILNNRVRELRAWYGFTQSNLGKQVAVTRQTNVDELFWLEGDEKDEK